jgi:hypothetical protein
LVKQAAEKTSLGTVLKGHRFVRADKPNRMAPAIQLAGKLSLDAVLKGHRFIRAVKSNKIEPALAAEGWFWLNRLRKKPASALS